MKAEPTHNPIEEVILRDVINSDIAALAQLHATAWRQTYEPIFGKNYQYPTAELRKQQWEQKLTSKSGNWFCIVAELKEGVIGFASGNDYTSSELPGFQGELNKLYLLKAYQGYSIGKKLFMEACNRFLKNNITTMVTFTEAQNPVGKFFEHLGGEKIFTEQGSFHGTYGWFDLTSVIKL
ncbi:MAG TPA: GNAT family N-acetyltransferase [Chitinophagaceae bacterium]|nr:GNAT family N-acetyltransferase [Chitinophagaceae bacterium]